MPNGKPGDQIPEKGSLSGLMPSREKKLKIWAIRSVIVIVAAYIFVAAGVGSWFLWAAWAYVALTLVLAFVLTRPASGGGSGHGSGGGSASGSD